MDHSAIAARWWADQLRQAAIHNTHGGKRDQDAIANSILLTLIAPATPLSDTQIAAFERAAHFVFQREYHASPRSWFPHKSLTISVDYHPCPLLEEAATMAGIDVDRRLPVKTVMWLEESGVTVACGYGAQPVALE